jgi:acyl-CoA thioesterase FadM
MADSLTTYPPTGVFQTTTPIRAYEPGATRRLGPGNALRYCEIAANMASAAAGFGAEWYFQRNEGWVIFRQTVELHAPIGPGEQLLMTTWVRNYTRVSSNRDYILRNLTNNRVVARTSTTWAYVDREQQTPKRIPQDFAARIPLHPQPALPERMPWGDELADPPPTARLELWARYYEADQLKHVNNCVYADWLDEAARLSFAAWRADPRLSTLLGRPVLPRRLTIHYQKSALPGDVVVISTRLTRVGARGVQIAQSATLRDDPAARLVEASAVYLMG